MTAPAHSGPPSPAERRATHVGALKRELEFVEAHIRDEVERKSRVADVTAEIKKWSGEG